MERKIHSWENIHQENRTSFALMFWTSDLCLFFRVRLFVELLDLASSSAQHDYGFEN